MNEPAAQPSARDRRKGLSRFIVPHASFHWYIRGIALSALACGSLFGLWSWLFHHRIFVSLGVTYRPEYPEFSSNYLMMSLSLAVVMAVTATLFMTIAAMFLFHRIAGPIYRLKMHMLSILEGRDFGELTLRDTDELMDVVEVYNRLLSHLDLIEPKPLETASDGSASPPQ